MSCNTIHEIIRNVVMDESMTSKQIIDYIVEAYSYKESYIRSEISYAKTLGLIEEVPSVGARKYIAKRKRTERNNEVIPGSRWLCIDESSEMHGLECVVSSVENEPNMNGDGTIELLYSDGTTYTGKFRRFMPGITHILRSGGE